MNCQCQWWISNWHIIWIWSVARYCAIYLFILLTLKFFFAEIWKLNGIFLDFANKSWLFLMCALCFVPHIQKRGNSVVSNFYFILCRFDGWLLLFFNFLGLFLWFRFFLSILTFDHNAFIIIHFNRLITLLFCIYLLTYQCVVLQ